MTARWQMESADEDENIDGLLAAGWEPYAVHRETREWDEYNEHRGRPMTQTEVVTVFHFRKPVSP